MCFALLIFSLHFYHISHFLELFLDLFDYPVKVEAAFSVALYAADDARCFEVWEHLVDELGEVLLGCFIVDES